MVRAEDEEVWTGRAGAGFAQFDQKYTWAHKQVRGGGRREESASAKRVSPARQGGERTDETSSFPKATPHVGHLRCRFESLASMHSLQKRCPQRLMMTPLNLSAHVEHLSIFCETQNHASGNTPAVNEGGRKEGTHGEVLVVLLELADLGRLAGGRDRLLRLGALELPFTPCDLLLTALPRGHLRLGLGNAVGE